MKDAAKKNETKAKKSGIQRIKNTMKARVDKLLKKAEEAIKNKDTDEAKHFLSQARSAAYKIKYDIDNQVIRMQEKIKGIKSNGKKKRKKKKLRKGYPTYRMGNPKQSKRVVTSRNSNKRLKD